jgi:hypothetical protein
MRIPRSAANNHEIVHDLTSKTALLVLTAFVLWIRSGRGEVEAARPAGRGAALDAVVGLGPRATRCCAKELRAPGRSWSSSAFARYFMIVKVSETGVER